MGSDMCIRAIPLTRKHISQMPYLDAVIKESMRLYPVAPFVVRKITAPLLLDENVVLPAGALAGIWIYSLQRHDDFWKDPHDFQPERWLDGLASINI